MDYLVWILSSLYAISGIIIIVGYYPTIKDLIHKKRSANVPSYIIWTGTYFVGFLYAAFVVKDLLFSILSMAGCLCCLVIWLLAARLK